MAGGVLLVTQIPMRTSPSWPVGHLPVSNDSPRWIPAQSRGVRPHTLNSHLRHAFGELDVNSRVELTRLADVHESRPSAPNSTKEKSRDRVMWVGAVCWDHDDIKHGQPYRTRKR